MLAALLAAPQLCATAGLVPETRRAVTGMSVGESLAFSLQPWRLAELVLPYPFGETWTLDPTRNWGAGIVRGILRRPSSAARSRFSRSWSMNRAARARFCRLLAAASVVLAAAGFLVPAGLRALSSPLPLRYPEKLAVGLMLALALQAGLGFDRIASAPRRFARLSLGAAGVLALLAAAAVLVLRGPARAQLPPALAEAGLIWAATSGALGVAGSGAAASRTIAAALLAILPLLATRRIALTDRDDVVFPPTAFARSVARRDPERAFRTVDASRYRPASALERFGDGASSDNTAFYRRSWYFQTPVLWNRGTVFNSDLDAGDLSRVESLRRVSAFAAGDPSGARALRVGRSAICDPLP